jgi:hypothetical protein
VGGGDFGGGDAYGYKLADATGIASAVFNPGTGSGTRTVRAKLSGTTIETAVTVVADTTLLPPQVVRTTPNQVLNVLTTVGVDFSKGIDPATVNTTTYAVKKSGDLTPLTGSYLFRARAPWWSFSRTNLWPTDRPTRSR